MGASKKNQKLNVLITNKYKNLKVPAAGFRKLIKTICGRFKISNATVSLTIVGDTQIRKINKQFLEHLMSDGLHFKDKTNCAYLPNKFLAWKCMKHILRGFFETDGCLFFAKINSKHTYPRIELKTNSQKLASQFFNALFSAGFKVRLRKTGKACIVYLSGKEQLEKWIKEIGFSSLKNISKYLLWKKLTFYIPSISTSERFEILRRQVELNSY